MQVNIINAIKYFYPTSSLEMVYFESIANALNAGANNIELKIKIDSFSKPDTLRIEVIDNGNGFVEKNFEQFKKLLEIADAEHKGAGRLVFLNYFDHVDITSIYDGKKRTFAFSEKFDGENELEDIDNTKNKTTLAFKGYQLDKINSYDYLRPDAIKKSLLLHFYPLLYSAKLAKTELRIKINLQTKEPNMGHGFFSDVKEIIASHLPDLEEEVIDANAIDLFHKLKICYSVKENLEEQAVITAICVDGRTISLDILSKETTPLGYEIIFLLYSDLFAGKVDVARQVLTLSEIELKNIKKLFSDRIAKILKERIPKIQKRNKEINETLLERFPHLKGYFEEESVGLIDRNKSLEIAQEKFFVAQKEILDSEDLSEEQFQKSLDISSRILMEYILYRNIIINKLKQINANSSEAEIHNIIIPMRKKFIKNDLIDDIYSNNAWLLDDKYMSYATILSDMKMSELIRNITLEDEIVEDESRPDIAVIFSNDPEKNAKVDVVIVELKKLNLELASKEEVESQLRQRARKLLKYYGNRIQRIWFYGIVDMDIELRKSLDELGYIELFSNDTLLYREVPIAVDDEMKIKIPVSIYILSFNAFLKDAENRNATFLQLLKEGLKQREKKG
jgi:hypothetical protein